MGSDLGNYLWLAKHLILTCQWETRFSPQMAPHLLLTRLATWKYFSQTYKHHGHVCRLQSSFYWKGKRSQCESYRKWNSEETWEAAHSRESCSHVRETLPLLSWAWPTFASSVFYVLKWHSTKMTFSLPARQNIENKDKPFFFFQCPWAQQIGGWAHLHTAQCPACPWASHGLSLPLHPLRLWVNTQVERYMLVDIYAPILFSLLSSLSFSLCTTLFSSYHLCVMRPFIW